MKRLSLLLVVASALACTAPAPVDPPASTAADMLAVKADSLRARVTRARFHTAVAIDSLDRTTPGLTRVLVEFRELERAADSLALITALERAALRARP